MCLPNATPDTARKDRLPQAGTCRLGQRRRRMRVLLADEDAVARHKLETYLLDWHYEVVAGRGGDEGWRALQAADDPALSSLEWMMPGHGGVQRWEPGQATG